MAGEGGIKDSCQDSSNRLAGWDSTQIGRTSVDKPNEQSDLGM